VSGVFADDFILVVVTVGSVVAEAFSKFKIKLLDFN
jgi:hypothetical protein